jgi:hypothetical protein
MQRRMTEVPELAAMVTFDFARLGAPNVILDDGQHFPLGTLLIRTFLSPGHSRGSICFHVGDVLFSGDVLFRGTSVAPTCRVPVGSPQCRQRCSASTVSCRTRHAYCPVTARSPTSAPRRRRTGKSGRPRRGSEAPSCGWMPLAAMRAHTGSAGSSTR